MAGIPGLDISELHQPYRDPRGALKGGAGGIPGLDVSELYDPARTQVARRGPYRPNFSMPGRGGAAAPVAAAPLQLTGGPGTAMVPRQNFTMGPDIAAFDPNAAPRLPAPALQAAAVNPDIAAASRVRVAGIPGSATFQGPQVPAGALPPVAPSTATVAEAAPSRFAAARAALNNAVPSPAIGEGALGAAGKAVGALARGAARVLPPVAQAFEAGQTVRDALAPDMTTIDKVARVAEGGARMAGMGAGGAAGAAAGTALLPGPGTVVGGIIGGGLGYLAPDIANKAYNLITGGDNQLASTTAAENRARSEPPAPEQAPVSAQNVAAEPPPSRDIAEPLGKEAQAAIDASRAAAAGSGQPPPSIGAPPPDISAATPVSPTLDASTQLALSAAKSEAAGRVDPGAHDANGNGGGAIGMGPNYARINAQHDRDQLMTTFDHISRMGSGRDRVAAIQAMGALGGQDLPGAGTQAAERVAGMRDSGETARANALNASNRAMHKGINEVAMRGQDIGAMTHSQSTKSALDIAGLHAVSSERIATTNNDGRVAAAEARAETPRWTPIQLPDVASLDGSVQRQGQAAIHNQTGEIRLPGGAKPPTATAAPLPPVGAISKRPNGNFRYKGGDASNPTSWEKI